MWHLGHDTLTLSLACQNVFYILAPMTCFLMILPFLTFLFNNTQVCKRWLVRGQICSVASLLTKTWQEFMALLLPNLTWWPERQNHCVVCFFKNSFFSFKIQYSFICHNSYTSAIWNEMYPDRTWDWTLEKS